MKKAIALSLLMGLLGGAACSSGEKKDDLVPVAPSTPTPAPTITYGQGFSDLERDGGGNSWRWMADEGIVKLKNTRGEMRLRIVGRAPIENFPQPPTIKIQFNGELLDQIAATPKPLDKEYTIPAAKQAGGEWSELRISSDKYFVPKERDKNSTDGRRLGFSLHKLEWEPK